jgi:small subunit ribosomal protein S10
MEKMYILSIKLKSFDTQRLKTSENQIQKLYQSISQKTAQDFGVIPLPEQRSHVTVLRSPHIDKKSREQFVFKKMQKLVQYKFKNQKALNFFLLGLKCLECTGVEIVIQLRSWNYYIETV